MKKISLLSVVLLMLGLSLQAQENISVGEVLVPQGHQGMLEVRFQFNANHDYVSYQFTVNLPDGIAFVTDDYDKPIVKLGDGQPSALYTIDLNASSHIVTCYSNPSTRIDGTQGVLVRIPVKAEATLEVGTVLNGSLSAVEFAHINAVSAPFSNAAFTVKVTDEIILDENSPIAPEDAENVKVRVKRTINANEWSTLCLPFDMTEEQVKTIFGNDVQLAEFTSYESVTEGSDVTSITVNFDDADLSEGFYGNWPYLIKTSKAVTEFSIDGVDIVNDIEAAVAEFDNGRTGRNRKVLGRFIGTYEAGTIVPDESLFLSENQFWYSAGKTKIKAYRAYFTLNDVLTNLNAANVKMALNMDGITTIIGGIGDGTPSNGDSYDLVGRKIDKPQQRGVYIMDGKKVLVK